MPQAPDEITWLNALGVLIGQADGEVFIPHSAIVAIKPYRLEIEKSLIKDGWYLRLIADGSGVTGGGSEIAPPPGQGTLQPPAHIDGPEERIAWTQDHNGEWHEADQIDGHE